MNANEGDTVTVQIDAKVVENYDDDKLLRVDADGVEMNVWEDEVVWVDNDE
jgi:hypothetical protein